MPYTVEGGWVDEDGRPLSGSWLPRGGHIREDDNGGNSTTTEQPSGGLTAQTFTPGQAGDPAYDANPRDFMAARDKGQWRLNLIDYLVRTKKMDPATAGRLADEEVSGVETAVRNLSNVGKDPAVFIEEAKRRIDARVANSNGPAGGDDGSGNGSGGASGAGGGSGRGGYGTNDFQWQPFTEQFSAPSRPGFIDERWNKTFVAPTQEEAQNDPGFKFTLDQGMQALNRSAAARGTALNPGTMKELNNYAQGLASTQYDNVYGRRFGEHQNEFGEFTTERSRAASNYGDTYDRAMQEYLNKYNIHTGNQANNFSTGLSRDQFGLDQERFGLDTTLANFNMGQQGRMNDFAIESGRYNMGQMGRMNDFSINQGLFGNNQTGRVNDFNMANTLRQNQFNNQYNLANLGLSAYDMFNNTDRNTSDLYTQQGNAGASGTAGSTNAIMQMFKNLMDQMSRSQAQNAAGR